MKAVAAGHEDAFGNAVHFPVVAMFAVRHEALGKHEIDVWSTEVRCTGVLVQVLDGGVAHIDSNSLQLPKSRDTVRRNGAYPGRDPAFERRSHRKGGRWPMPGYWNQWTIFKQLGYTLEPLSAEPDKKEE